MKIPDDMYERVFDLACSMTNASEAADDRAYWRLYGELRTFCEAESEAKRDHPFLWETLADFTTDDQLAIGLYLKALESAKDLAGAAHYEASILLAMAERHRNVGDAASAHRYAADANERAKGLDDLDLRRSISQFLLDESTR